MLSPAFLSFMEVFMLGGLLNYLNLMTTPFEILSDSDTKSDFYFFLKATGINSLGGVMEAAGILSAAIIIVASLVMLAIVNYPKTKAQTKEKLVNTLTVVAFIAAFPYLADAIYTIILDAFF